MTTNHVAQPNGSRVGRPPRYGEAAIQRPVYWPPMVLKRLKEEAAWCGARTGDPENAKVSDLVVQIVAGHFDIDLPTATKEPRDGR